MINETITKRGCMVYGISGIKVDCIERYGTLRGLFGESCNGDSSGVKEDLAHEEQQPITQNLRG